MKSVVQVLRDRQKEARETAEKLMSEALELEEYAKKLDPAIELLNNLPELADNILSKIGPIPNRRPRGQIMELVFTHLRSVGPAKVVELERKFELSDQQVYNALTRLREKGDANIDEHGVWFAVRK